MRTQAVVCDRVRTQVYAAVLSGSTQYRRLFHRTQRPCRILVGVDGIARFKPQDPVCDGLCVELAFRGVENFNHRRHGPLTPARAQALGQTIVIDEVRKMHAAHGMYVRLERLNPDAAEYARSVPRWYLDALPDQKLQRRAHAMLTHVRTMDVTRANPWPLQRWAEEDGLGTVEEQARINEILRALQAKKPAFVNDNITRPISRAATGGGLDAILDLQAA